MNGSLRMANLSVIGKCNIVSLGMLTYERQIWISHVNLSTPFCRTWCKPYWGDGMQVLSSCATCLIRKYECMHAHLYYRSICSKSSALRLGSASFLLAVFDSCSQTFFRVRFQSLINIYWSFKTIASSRLIIPKLHYYLTRILKFQENHFKQIIQAMILSALQLFSL